MSASLARLRRVFGDPLLIRSGRTFTLTPLAQSLAGPLQAVLADVENVLTQRPGFDPASDARTFTVLGSDYVTFILLRHFVPALYAQAPGVTIRISPLAAGFQQSLDRGDADVLILPAKFDRELLRFPHTPAVHRRLRRRGLGGQHRGRRLTDRRGVLCGSRSWRVSLAYSPGCRRRGSRSLACTGRSRSRLVRS